MVSFAVGDRVVRNPATWRANAFDSWGRGVGVGIVVEPPNPLDPDEVDVRWRGGRCFERAADLLPAEDAGPATAAPARPPMDRPIR
jgi:hypothetical protein